LIAQHSVQFTQSALPIGEPTSEPADRPCRGQRSYVSTGQVCRKSVGQPRS